jgi:hypothetical protein
VYRQGRRQVNPPEIVIAAAFESPAGLGYVMRGKPAENMTYSKWRAALGVARMHGPYRCARLVAVGENAVIQTVDGLSVSSHVVQGRDPTNLRVGGDRVDVLEIFPRHVEPPALVVYVEVSRRPTIPYSEKIVTALQGEMGPRRLEVYIRPDTWFIDDSFFPLWFRFQPDAKEPTLEQYKSRGEVWCEAEPGRTACNIVHIIDSPPRP